MNAAYLMYHDPEREVSFRWDGTSPNMRVTGGGFAQPVSEALPLQSHPYDDQSPIGWLRWFQSVCESHIRLREAADEPIVRPQSAPAPLD